MSLVVMPFAYIERIFSSISGLMLVWFFFRSCGSYSSLRSRGTETSTSPKLVHSILLLCTIPAVVSILVLVIILAVTEFVIHFYIESIFHEFGNGFLEQILDVIHAADISGL